MTAARDQPGRWDAEIVAGRGDAVTNERAGDDVIDAGHAIDDGHDLAPVDVATEGPSEAGGAPAKRIEKVLERRPDAGFDLPGIGVAMGTHAGVHLDGEIVRPHDEESGAHDSATIQIAANGPGSGHGQEPVSPFGSDGTITT
jgi:hypothetical protein